jgi:hypothetical protein
METDQKAVVLHREIGEVCTFRILIFIKVNFSKSELQIQILIGDGVDCNLRVILVY